VADKRPVVRATRRGAGAAHATRAATNAGRRCAIYTRKSSEEGLEQAFNSLDAQREACEAYARSQRHEGWMVLPAQYDDGGISGGTLDRPALQRLLADIQAGRVDLVLVYKVDRLTRSLADFAKIVDVLDANGASFVSVTQHFNTASSMGRLTLNMLLSFAQFEREVAGERIRDKIAAAKRKGIWMGGSVPLGYVVRDRKLVIDEAEAARVRSAFERYVQVGSVRLLTKQLAADGVTSKSGGPLGRGPLFHLLQNRTYRGEIAHHGNIYPGEHAAIIDAALWDAAQRRLAENRNAQVGAARATHPSLLAGLLFDAAGEPMSATHAVKAGRRYRYYVSRSLIVGTRETSSAGLRLPAHDVERVVLARLGQFLADEAAFFTAVQAAGLLPESVPEQRALLLRAAGLAASWSGPTAPAQRAMLLVMLRRIDARAQVIDVHVCVAGILTALAEGGAVRTPAATASHTAALILSVPARLRRAGKEMALVVGGEAPNSAVVDAALVAMLVKARALRDALVRTDAAGIADYAAREGLSKSYVTRLVRLAWLAPDIAAAIATGRQPAGLTATRLMSDTRLPLAWDEQRRALGMG